MTIKFLVTDFQDNVWGAGNTVDEAYKDAAYWLSNGVTPECVAASAEFRLVPDTDAELFNHCALQTDTLVRDASGAWMDAI